MNNKKNISNETEKQIFCADADICAIIAKQNAQNKWELWGLSEVLETGEAKYKIRLFSDEVFDAVESINTTSGRTYIKVLQDNIWQEVVLTETKKAISKPIYPGWTMCFENPPSPMRPSYLKLEFTYEDENESIESLVKRGAGENPLILIDQINLAGFHSQKRDERLLSVIEYFLKNGIDVNAKNECGETALMAAAYYGNTDVVNLLLQHGAKVNDKSNFGNTAVMTAFGELYPNVVDLLIKNGAEVDADCFFSIFSEWDLGTDEIQTQIDFSKLLLNKNIDVNTRAFEGQTVLMLMAETGYCDYREAGDYDEAKLLLEKQTELLQLLLDNGVDINAKDNEGKTALMYAIVAKNKHIAECLLEHDADVNIKDNEGNTALEYAQKSGVRIVGKLHKK